LERAAKGSTSARWSAGSSTRYWRLRAFPKADERGPRPDSKLTLIGYAWSFACPMMNDTTLRQIAAVNTMVNRGNHIWSSNII